MMINGKVQEILTHKQDAFNRLLEQYKNSENLKSIIGIYADQIQEAESLLQAFYLRLDIMASEGIQLDNIGEIVVQPRGANNDERYRKLLLVKVGINNSEGVPEDIIPILQLLTEANYVHYINLSDGEMEFEVAGDLGEKDDINELFLSLREVIAGGTRVSELRETSPGLDFGFDGPNNPPFLGFDDPVGDPGSGGCFPYAFRYGVPFAFSDESGEDTDISTEGFGAGELDPILGGEFIS